MSAVITAACVAEFEAMVVRVSQPPSDSKGLTVTQWEGARVKAWVQGLSILQQTASWFVSSQN